MRIPVIEHALALCGQKQIKNVRFSPYNFLYGVNENSGAIIAQKHVLRLFTMKGFTKQFLCACDF